MSRAEAAHPDRAAADPGQPVPHLSPEERAALGKAARERTPRATQAHFARPDGQPDAVDRLESQAASRVPDLVPIRYGRMMTSPFAFYRGAALVMASDLAGTPNSGLRVQLCGDAHMSNFGVFASPERRLVFDINDFDETLPGPWEWDVKRLAASLEIAARQNGFAEKARKDILLTTLRGYREPMRRFAAMRTLDVWYSTADMAELQVQMADQLDQSRTKRLSKELAKARTKDSLQAFEKLTHLVGGERRIAADPPLIVPIADLAPGLEQDRLREEVHRLVQKYRETLQSDRRVLLEEFRYVDLARKVVGVGSVGTRAWIALLLGRDEEDPLFLQVKEAQTSVLAGHAGTASSPTRASGSWPASGSCRHPATSSSAGCGPKVSTASSVTSTSASCGTGRARSCRRRWWPRAWRSTAGCAGGRWPGPTPAPVTGSRSRPTSVAARPSTGQSRSSRWPTRIRTSATTPHSPRRWSPVG